VTLTFRDLIAPMTPEAFLTEGWQRKPFVVHGDVGKLRALLDMETFYRAVGEERAGGVMLRAGAQNAGGDHVEVAITANQIPPLLGLGMTVHAFRLETVHAPARALIEDARRTLGVAAAMDVGAFLSPDGAGFGIHYDGTATWSLQVEGEKIWWHGREPVVPSPQRNHIATATERAAIAEGELVEQRLRPGDVLYLPPGTWHCARAVGHSLHASLNIRPSSVLDLVHDALSPLLDDARWRRLPLGAEEEVATELAERLGELHARVAALTPEALVDAWRLRSEGGASLAPIRPAEVLAVVAAIDVVEDVDPDGDECLALRNAGEPVATLPGHAARFLAALRVARRFRAGDAMTWDLDYSWEDVEAVLRSLVNLGLLARELA
jgi:ribosomal protein L16 Arg81 hydroxylase